MFAIARKVTGMEHDRHADIRRTICVSEGTTKRRYPIGAEIIAEDKTHFRVWAPKANTLEVVLQKNETASFHSLGREDGGYFAGIAECGAGARYKFRINDGESLPD